MTLNIEVKGDPASIRATGYWLNGAKAVVDGAGTAAYGARSGSTTWTGGAGDGFRTVMTTLGGIADGLATKTNATGAALVVFAGELQTVKTRMASARQVATTGGLTVTATTILPPGPAPASPGALPPNATPHQKSAHTAAAGAAAAHVKKVKAYQQASVIVSNARAYEQMAQRKLGAGPLKDLATVTDLGVGATVGAAEVASKFRVDHAHFDALATRAARMAKSTDPATRAAALRKLASFAIQAEQYRVAAESNLVARFGASQPQWVKNLLAKPVVGGIPKPTPQGVRAAPPAGRSVTGWVRAARNGAKILGRIPLIGIGLAAVGVGLDIAAGTDPVKAVASGAAGVAGGVLGGAVGAAAGAAVGASIGGPPGAAIGGVIGGIGGGILVGSVASGAVEQAFG